MKRYSKRFLAFLLAFVLILGTVPIVGAAERTFTGSEKLYVNLSAVDWWQNDDAVHALYFFGSNGNAWALMEQAEGNIYGAAVPAGTWTHVIVVRLKSGTTTPNWNDKWSQSGDIPLDAEKNYITSFAEGSTSATWDVYDDAGVDYYLFGSINGADYGCEDDYETLGEYKFFNGKLTATFTEDSYVGVKTGDNAHWYMTDGWLGTETTSATLYNSDTYTFADKANKLYVPGGVEVTFTLSVDAANDQLVLSYSTGGDTPEPPDPPVPGNTDYYLVGYFNGADYTGNDYKFVDGKLSASFTADSYVAVKTGAGVWYMTMTYSPAPPATLYNTKTTTAGEKLFVPGDKNIEFTLTVNDNDTLSLTYTSSSQPSDHTGADDKVMLHCWNWSFDEIREYLPQIQAAGYTAVQTSPAQPHSGYFVGDVGTGDWWMLYQPLGLHIAQAGQSWLGDENDLRELCDAAHELGIEVIVDVVANHICNGYNDIAATGKDPRAADQIVYSGGGKTGYLFETQPDARVMTYNPELFPNGTASITQYFRDYVLCNDETTENVVHGNIGMPDFKTEEPVVQQSVLNYLKELIDVGVDGFRFDAAKHIETPNDGALGSRFWPTVIDGAEAYAETKGKTIWAYGEVLSTAGKTRKMNDYAPYIDMTEISYAYTITEAIGDHKGASAIANQLFKDWLGVGVETLKNSSLVLMAESHDMYAQGNDSFSRYGAEVINKAWAVAAARADTSSLYFARPQGYVMEGSYGVPVGTLGKCDNTDWMNPEVSAVNKFHTAFVGAEENVYASGDLVVVERCSDTECGAVLVNAGGSSASVNIRVSELVDGTYYDQITGNEFTVSGGNLSGSMGATGIVVLRSIEPVVCDHPADQRTQTVTEPTCTEPGWTYTYCDVCHQLLSKVKTSDALGHIDENGDQYCDRCGEFLGVITVYFVDTNDWIPENDYYNNIRVHAWSDSGASTAWPGVDMEIVGRTTDDHGIWKTEMNPEKYTMLLFNAGENGANQTVDLSYVTDAGDKNYVVYTADYNPSGRVFDGTESLYLNTAAVDWWCNDGAILTMTLSKADGSDVILNLTPVDGAVYGVVIPAGSYMSLVLSRLDPDSGNAWNSTGSISIPPQGNYIESFNDGSAAATWSFWPSGSAEKVNAAPGAVLEEICGHTGYEIISANGVERYVCDCCGTTFKTVYIDDFQFEDVTDPDKYYYEPVYWALRHDPQITAGMSDTLFGVKNNCTRAQIVTFLWKASGAPKPSLTNNPFTDVKAGKYYYDAVLWAVEKGVTSGKSDTVFGVSDTCTRGEAMTFLWAASGKPEPTTTDNPFEDVKESNYFYKAVLWAVENEITGGTSDTTFSPKNTCTRAQIVTFLYKAASFLS